MSLIEELTIGLGLEVDGFDRDMRKPIKSLESLQTVAGETQRSLSGIDAPTIGSRDSSGPSNVSISNGSGADIGQMAALASGQFDRLGMSMKEALTPLSTIAGTISAQINEVGGTITALARRIDSAMKMPGLNQALKKTESELTGFAGTSDEVLNRFRSNLSPLGKLFLTLTRQSANFTSGSIREFRLLYNAYSRLSDSGDVAKKSLSQLDKPRFTGPIAQAQRFSSVMAGPVKSSVQEVSSSVKGLSFQLGAALGVVGIAFKAVQFVKDGIKGASDLQETLDRAKTVLNGAEKPILDEADQLAAKFGVVKNEYIGAATSFAAIFKGTGKELTKSVELGNKLARLGLDLGSQDNQTNASAFAAISSALKGEMNPIEKFNIFLNQDRIAAEALAMGFKKVGGSFDEGAKKAATVSLIMQQSQKKMGDLERTAGGAANQFRKAGGGLTNFSVVIGQTLLPTITVATAAFNEFLAFTVSGFDRNKDSIKSAVQSIASGVQAGYQDLIVPAIDLGRQAFGYFREAFTTGSSQVGGALQSVAAFFKDVYDGTAFALRNLGDIFTLTAISAQETLMNWGAQADVFGQNMSTIASFIARNWYELIVDGMTATGTFLVNFWKNIGNLASAGWKALTNPSEGFKFEWTPLLDGFKATTEKFPELAKAPLISLQDDMDAVMNKISQMELNRSLALTVKKPGESLPKPGEDIVPTAKAAEMPKNQFADLAELGSKEAYSAVIRARAGAGADATKDVAKNTKEANGILKSIRDSLKSSDSSSLNNTYVIGS